MEHSICSGNGMADFIRQFLAIAAAKKYSEEEKLVIFPGLLRGAALALYRAIEAENLSFADLVARFKAEFAPEENPQELFYNRRQEEEENILDFYYNFLELAAKAGVKEDSIFITQFLKAVKPFYKHKLATSLFRSKEDLKSLILQLKKIYERNKHETPNVYANPSLHAPGYRTYAARDSPSSPRVTFQTPNQSPGRAQSSRPYDGSPRPSRRFPTLFEQHPL